MIHNKIIIKVIKIIIAKICENNRVDLIAWETKIINENFSVIGQNLELTQACLNNFKTMFLYNSDINDFVQQSNFTTTC